MAAYRPVDPKQSFPELEERVLERWRERDVFHRSLAQRQDAPVWSFYEGPPTANGEPGSHHVLSRVFKDIYPRFQTMRGHRVPRKAGWDCHGLPVELEVEKELGISSKAEIEAYGIAEFNQRCRESVFRYVEEWNRLTERIGFWIDLDDPYVTLTNSYIESVWWSLRKIWDDGRLYEAHKVVPYCPRDGTGLSSHEVAQGYQDVEDPSVYVRLPVRQPEAPLQEGDALLVWTTTPWTLISNAAVAIGPEIEYVRVRPAGSDEVVVIAAPLVERVLGEGAEVLDRLPGSALAGTSYQPPFPFITDYGPRGHTVLEADFVTTDEGTGLVHTAIAFGEDDFRLGEQYGIKLQNPVREDGTFDERITDFAGQFVKDADPAIVEALRDSGRLFRAERYRHSYPHCWRCGTPLLYYAKSSWYVRTTDVRERMLAENEKIGWHPEHIKHGRFGNWLEGNVDWALSRERYWGTPLPIWECGSEGCEERFCAGSIADLRERGAQVPDDLHRPYIDEVTLRCESCGGEMRRVRETIDAWYDSGSMPFAQFHYPFEGEELFADRFPADFISEAIDQTRGWFYSLLAISVLVFDRASYRNCVVLGLILDPEGQKMSKSRGNVVDPWEVIGRHGADAFRWYYFTAQQPWAGYRFSADTVGESVRQFMLTLWNTYAFWVLYANAEGSARRTSAPRRLAAARSGARTRRRPRSLGALAAPGHGADGDRGPGRLRLHDGRSGHRRLRRGALQLVRATLATALLGGGPRRLRHPPPLPAHGRHAPGALHAVRGRRDLREPGRGRGGGIRRGAGLRSPARLPRARPRARGSRAGGRGRGGTPRGRAGTSGSRPGPGQGAPAASQGGDRGQRRRAGGHRAARRAGRRGVEREGARVRLRGGGAGALSGEAELPNARPPLRQADAERGRRGRGARRVRGRRRGRGAHQAGNQRGRAGARAPTGRRDAGHEAARRLPGRGGGGSRGGAGRRARRRAPSRGAGARDRPRRSERPPRVRPGGHRPDRAEAGGGRRAPGRRSRPRGIRGRRDARHLRVLRRRRGAGHRDRGPRAADRTGAIRARWRRSRSTPSSSTSTGS